MRKLCKELKSDVESRLGKNLTYEPIGHHDLGRHFVYLVRDKLNNEYILKIYGRELRWCKEVVALGLLNKRIPCPRIIEKGKLSDGTEWLITNKIPGVTLEKVWNDIPKNNKEQIIEDLGDILGIIHKSYSYSYYGPWKECGPGVVNHIDFLQHRKKNDKRIIMDILKQDLPHKELLIKAYHRMVEFYSEIIAPEKTSICHHDFSSRNILVIEKRGKWEITGIIDFEHSYPNDPDIDFTDLYQTIFLDDHSLEFIFLKGYTNHRSLSKNFDKKVRYYLFNKGLLICSWAFSLAPEYYNDGIELLKFLMNGKE